MAGISHNVRRPQYRYLSTKRLRRASHSSLWCPSLAAILFNISGGSRWIRGGVPLPKWPRRPHGPINPQRRPLPLSSIQGFYDPGNSINGGRLLYFTVKRWPLNIWRHMEVRWGGCLRMHGQESDNGHSFSFRANISGRLSRTCRDAACWGFVGETIWDFCLYCRPSAARTRRRRRGAFVKPLENGSHQSREAYVPSHNLHPQAMERDAARGDRDRQLTKNNMCLTQPRMGKKGVSGRNSWRRDGASENMRAGEMKVTLCAAIRGCGACSQPAPTPTRWWRIRTERRGEISLDFPNPVPPHPPLPDSPTYPPLVYIV